MNRIYLILIIYLCCNSIKASDYIEGDHLLTIKGSDILWGQSYNNEGNCYPAYNSACPSGYSGDPCGHNYVGCGAVAMGMCLRKWEWPYVSQYGYYRWDLMYSQLRTGHTDFTPNFLRDCGTASNIRYETFLGVHEILGRPITGSWTLIRELENGINAFGYNSLRYKKEDWNYGDAWINLIKSEISCGRPVLFFGEDFDDILSIISSHYYVVDGYYSNLFHCNFGWRGSDNANFQNILNRFNHNVEVIGFSPNFVDLPNLVQDVNFEIIDQNVQIAAKHVISLPASGKVLVNNTDNRHIALVAGDSIVLKNGVQLTNCQLIVRPELAKAQHITYQQINNIVQGQCRRSPNYNNVRFHTQNADSWECSVFNRYGERIWRNAGVIRNDTACVWDGSSVDPLLYAETYWLDVIFKNSYGSIVNVSTHVAYDLSPCVINYAQLNRLISPNCVDGVNDFLEFETDAETWSCKIFKRNGTQIWSSSGNVVDGRAKVWDGSAFNSSYLTNAERYNFEVKFRTSDGGYVETTGDVYYFSGDCVNGINDSEIMRNIEEIERIMPGNSTSYNY